LTPGTPWPPRVANRVDGAARFLPAAREALAAFPVLARDLQPVWLSENATFKVTDQEGRVLALRLHRPGYHTLAELESERDWTSALNAAGVAAPIGLRTHRDAWYVPVATVEDTGLGVRLAGLTTWTDGEVLRDVLDRDSPVAAAEHFRRLGETVAALHAQAADWTPPLNFTRHSLDAEGLVGAAPLWGPFWKSPALSSTERALLRNARQRLAAALERLGRGSDTFGLIHADLHPGNVLTKDGVQTVIDFDDAAFGWRAFDIAVAVGRHWREADFDGILAAFLKGYAAVRLPDRNTETLVPMFCLIRALSVIGWLDQRRELDGGSYLNDMKEKILAACEGFQPPC
jgi:Ser/Thr protein kinase RdoA (MazF antagonist)